jgi:integrase
MAREAGIYRRGDSRYWWIAATLPNGQRVRQSAGTENRKEAEALLAKLKVEAFRASHFGIKPQRSWQEAVVRYLTSKSHLRSFADVQLICRKLDRYLGQLTLQEINGDVIWRITQGELKRGNRPATVNRYLSLMRNLLRTARDEWQWIEAVPKVRLLSGEVERDRWLTQGEAERLLAVCASHLAAMVRFALSTGCRAREITGLEWDRVDLARQTAWLDHTKNGTPRGVPLNRDAVVVLEEERGKHPVYCFSYRGQPIRWELTNSAWHTAIAKAGIADFRFHDLRHTWASWHRQAGTSCDELKDLGGWKSRVMVDRYAKFGTEHLTVAAARIERERDKNVIELSRFSHGKKAHGALS